MKSAGNDFSAVQAGIVLLGATLPLTLILSAGPIAFLQATLVSVGTWLTIYFSATRIFGLEKQFGAVLGGPGDDQWSSSLIDQNRIDFVDHRKT